MAPEMIDLSGSRYDLTTYRGRVKHYFEICDPRKMLATKSQLYEAKELLQQYKAGLCSDMPEDELWKAKRLYDSAFHPDTGELVFLPARMSFQVVGNMMLLGLALTFYESAVALAILVCANQMFNAMVNFFNRNATSTVSKTELLFAFLAATFMGTMVAVSTRKFIDNHPALQTGMLGRFIPMTSGTAANFVNIPLMRQNELLKGVKVYDELGKEIGVSRKAARIAVLLTVLSRVIMAAPAACLTPIIMSLLQDNVPYLDANRYLSLPIQVAIVGLNLSFCTPCACALFSQRQKIRLDVLEPQLASPNRQGQYAWFNKGL